MPFSIHKGLLLYFLMHFKELLSKYFVTILILKPMLYNKCSFAFTITKISKYCDIFSILHNIRIISLVQDTWILNSYTLIKNVFSWSYVSMRGKESWEKLKQNIKYKTIVYKNTCFVLRGSLNCITISSYQKRACLKTYNLFQALC